MTVQNLYQHLATTATTLCRAWVVVRTDGLVLGFTDHDRDLEVDGTPCRADTGMTARALQQTTGLSVDNSEAIGGLSDLAITEADILAGRFDNAEVRAYLVNWAEPTDFGLQFRGTIGEIQRAGGSFRAELRGLSEALNRAQGLAYQPRCTAILGDRRCGFDTAQPGYSADVDAYLVEGDRIFRFELPFGFDEGWFEHGRLEVLGGAAAGLVGQIKIDRVDQDWRRVELWQSLGAKVVPGDRLRIIAGCNKSASTCRAKFANFLNFRGFPHIPGEDWLASYPVSDRPNTGGSRQRGDEG